MVIEKYEVVKEYRFTIEDIEFPIKGRILKILDESYSQQFLWDISHFCKPFEEAATAYVPSNPFGASIQEAESKLMKYANEFTTFGILENIRY